MNHLHWDLTQFFRWWWNTTVFWQSTVQNQQQCFIHQKMRLNYQNWWFNFQNGDRNINCGIKDNECSKLQWPSSDTWTSMNGHELGKHIRTSVTKTNGWDLVKNTNMDQHFRFGKYDNLSMHSVKWLHIECEQMEVELVYKHAQSRFVFTI